MVRASSVDSVFRMLIMSVNLSRHTCREMPGPREPAEAEWGESNQFKFFAFCKARTVEHCITLIQSILWFLLPYNWIPAIQLESKTIFILWYGVN